MDDKELEFRFSPDRDNPMIGGELEKMKSQSTLIIEADGHLYMIPTANIRYIETTPTPPKLPANIIRAASVHH